MVRSLLVSILLMIASVVAVVAVTFVTNGTRAASSPVVSTHESSGLDVRATSPNPNASGRPVVVAAPDPYRRTPVATCEKSYVSTIGDKNILKYGTTQHCGEETAPQPQTDAEINA
jgi:hypothetical protein